MRKYLSLKTIPVFTVFLMAGLLVFNARHALAQLWVEYQADSGIFTVKAPEEYESTISEFLVADNRSIASEEMSALIDQRPFKNVIKGYIVRADQTLGGGMSDPLIDLLLERELNLYEDFYLAHGGRVKSRKMDDVLNQKGGELVITYDDPEFGPQTVKIRVLFSRSTRLEQIIIAPTDGINSQMNTDYLESLQFFDGLKITEKTLKFIWEATESPLKIFTIDIPPVQEPFFPFPPKIQYSKDAEIVSLLFRDPVRNESMYYNVYAYKFDRFINGNDIQNLIVKNHILKHNADPMRVSVKITDERLLPGQKPRQYKRKLVEALFNIPPVPDFPFLQTVNLKAIAEGKILIVKEIVASQPMALSYFTETLFNSVSFHPEDYTVPATAQVAGGVHQMDTPIQNMPGGSLSLTEKLRSAITVTTDKANKPKRDPNKPELKPLPDTLPADEVRDVQAHQPKASPPPVQPSPAPGEQEGEVTVPGGSTMPLATP